MANWAASGTNNVASGTNYMDYGTNNVVDLMHVYNMDWCTGLWRSIWMSDQQ